MRGKFFYLFLFAMTACQPMDQTSDGTSGEGASSQTLLQELKSIATGACSKTSDCYSAAIGSRACGGPEDYMVFSKWDSASKILDTVYSYNQARQKETSGSVGTCEYRMPPAVTCSENKCKKQSGSDTEGTSFSVIPGIVTLAPTNVADAATMTFKAENNSTTYYLRLSQVDFTTRTKIESYRKSDTSVKVNVRIFALRTEAPACEFMYSTCTTLVNVFDVRAVRILSVQ